MRIEQTRDGRKITHPSGLVVIETQEQLRARADRRQANIDRLLNEKVEIENDISEITILKGVTK